MRENQNEDWLDAPRSDQKQDILENISEADNAEIVSHLKAVKLFEKSGLK